MSSAEEVFHHATRGVLAEIGAIDDDELVTHYVLVAATSDMATGESGVTVLHGPAEDGLPTWQVRGLLEEAKRYIEMEEEASTDSDDVG